MEFLNETDADDTLKWAEQYEFGSYMGFCMRNIIVKTNFIKRNNTQILNTFEIDKCEYRYVSRACETILRCSSSKNRTNKWECEKSKYYELSEILSMVDKSLANN